MMIKITFPDGSVREYEQGITGQQVAESISPRLAKEVLACSVNGETVELNRPIQHDAELKLFKWEDEEGKHAFWHTRSSRATASPSGSRKMCCSRRFPGSVCRRRKPRTRSLHSDVDTLDFYSPRSATASLALLSEGLL